MLKVVNLYKTFKTSETKVEAIKNLNFEVEKKQFFTLLGPSGCGKTSTLRCVAGLEDPDSGQIIIDGEKTNDGKLKIPTSKRPIGIVFQSYAVWPHMDVFGNVSYPLKYGSETKLSKSKIKERVREALAQVRLEGFEKRPATQLSGGQQQRVALARALVRHPKLLLLDEPLSNLDAKLREQMRLEIKDLSERLGITCLYVTHDQVEALSMSDVVAVMMEGQIVQMGHPLEIYTNPKTAMVAGFIGVVNFIKGTVLDFESNRKVRVDTPMGILKSSTEIKSALNRGDNVLVSIRPENISLIDESDEENIFRGKIDRISFVGESADCWVNVINQQIRLKLHPLSPVRPKESVFIKIPYELCTALPA